MQTFNETQIGSHFFSLTAKSSTTKLKRIDKEVGQQLDMLLPQVLIVNIAYDGAAEVSRKVSLQD